MTRRGCLAGLVGAAGAGRAAANVAQGSSLAEAAARSGRVFGAAAQINQIAAEPDLREAVLRECAWLTPELAMKWDAMEPAAGRADFRRMDRLADFARRNGKRLRGHTLIWHGSTPAWAERALTGADGWDLVLRRFAAVLPRYADMVEEWDVVNEPMDTGHRQDGLRPSVFLQAFGPDYIPRSLDAARRFAPTGRLMINEYGVDYDIRLEEDRRYLFLRLLERLKHSGAPLDGVGIQAHLDLAKGRFSPPVFASFLQAIADLGLSITITELDIKEADYALPVEERDRRVADAARTYVETALAQPAVRGVLTWGLSDRHSWLKVTADDLARHRGAWRDGSGPGFNRGLPFDASMRPKPLRQALADAFAGAPKGCAKLNPSLSEHIRPRM